MRASHHPQLGRVVAQYLRTLNDLMDDPISAQVGFMPDPTPQLEQLVQREGFTNLQHFHAVVQWRTSHRFTHFNLP